MMMVLRSHGVEDGLEFQRAAHMQQYLQPCGHTGWDLRQAEDFQECCSRDTTSMAGLAYRVYKLGLPRLLVLRI